MRACITTTLLRGEKFTTRWKLASSTKNPSKFKLNKTVPGGRIHPGSNQKFKFESGFFVFLREKSRERKGDRGCSTLVHVMHT